MSMQLSTELHILDICYCVSVSSNDSSDRSSSSEFSDSEVHTKSKLLKKENVINLAAISNNENSEISNVSKQTTDSDKEFMKSQIIHEGNINEENENMLSFKDNNNTEEKGILIIFLLYI